MAEQVMTWNDDGHSIQLRLSKSELEITGISPAESIDICWTLIGDSRVIEECQLWFMPKSDEVFSAWLETKKNTD